MSELSDSGLKEFEHYIERFKIDMKKASEECLGEIYINLSQHIESDSWQNYRNVLRSEMAREYKKEVIRWGEEQYWAKEVRATILKEHRAELVDAINKDLEFEINKLKDDLSELRIEYSRSQWSR